MAKQQLAEKLKGHVLAPTDAGYDEARHVWNARFQRRPDLVARCADADDVAAAVTWARSNGLQISVKSGGHSYAGNTVADGGLLIDLSQMNSIEVDPQSRTVAVEAGATWGELDAATQAHGLATTGVTVSSVGVAGSTLGGGSGYLSRVFGNAIDNLVSVELVTAEGRRLRAAEAEHPDLFWGLRGAGANFGVATSFEFRLHEVGPQVLAGQVIYPFDEAGELFRFFREFMADAPEQLQCFAFTLRIPPVKAFPERFHGQPALDFVVFHLDAEALDAVQPLRELGETILDTVQPVPYTVAQQAFDPNLPADQRYYSKAHDLAGLTDEAIDTITEQVPRMEGPLSVAYLEPRGGAVARVAPGETAAGGRGAPYSLHILAGWVEAQNDGAVMGWANSFHEAMAPHATGGVYVNLLAEDEPERVPAAYSDHERLTALKRQWDPDNVFQGNHNIRPS